MDPASKMSIQASDEWKECRTSIGRFDNYLVDLRKYGFTLITGLSTANYFWFHRPVDPSSGKCPTAAEVFPTEAGVALVLTLLIAALFVVDRSYEVLLHAAVKRGIELETTCDAALTTRLSKVASRAKTDTWAAVIYGLFMLVAQIPWVLSSNAIDAKILRAILVAATLTILVLGFWYHLYTKKS